MNQTSPESEPVAWTNEAQLGFLKDPTCADIPMAMWAKPSGTADIPLYRGVAPTPAVPGMQGAVQYRRKDGGYGPDWITMAMFDGMLAAENYCNLQRKDDKWPFEYRAIELAMTDTSTEGNMIYALAAIGAIAILRGVVQFRRLHGFPHWFRQIR